MYNVLLDPLPEEWNGHKIDTSFQNGIQIMQIMADKEISEREKAWHAADLLFFDAPETLQEVLDAIVWFLSDWNHDHPDGKGKKEPPVVDWDIDQWRIYSAFQSQYGINLNRSEMHFWEFMGLLTTLDECAFTRVTDIRAKKLNGKMDQKEKAFYRQAKRRYAIESVEEEEETMEDLVAVEEFRRLAGLR